MPIFYGNDRLPPGFYDPPSSPYGPPNALGIANKPAKRPDALMQIISGMLTSRIPGEPSAANGGDPRWYDRYRGLGGQAGSQLGIPAPGSLEDIMSRLNDLQDSSRYTPPMDMLEKQARAMAAAQYDPVIARLRNQMGLSQVRAERNKQALGSMFNQLSGNLSGEIPGINQMYQGEEQKNAQQYEGLKQGIQDQYAKSQADQESMMQRLNIQAAAPDALAQQQVDKNFFVNQASQDEQVQQNAMGQEQRGAVEYTRKGSQMAQAEGTQRQADLMFQLQDLLAQYEGQIGEAEAGKNSTYLSNLYGLQNNSQQQAMDRAQRDFENYIKVLNVGQSLQKAGQVLNVQSPADVSKRVMGMGIDPAGAQSIQNVFMSALSSDPMIQAGIDQNFGQALPKEALAARIVEAGRQQGLNPQQLNALQVAALEYFGRR